MTELTPHEERLRLKLQLAQTRDYLSFRDVMILTNLSSSTLHRRIKSKSLHPIQHVKGGKLLFKKESIMKFMNRGQK